MSLSLQRADNFWTDLTRQVDWYRDEASPSVAERFVDAVEMTLNALLKQPGLGRARFRKWPELAGIHSFRIKKPFHRFLIFYRVSKDAIEVVHILHGARDYEHLLFPEE